MRRERAWYTLFAHALIISVIARICVILENISEVSFMGVYKNTKIPKNLLQKLLVQQICQACGIVLLGQSLAKLVAI